MENVPAAAFSPTLAHTRADSPLLANEAEGEYYDVILGAVIGTVTLVLLCLVVVALRYVYRHKGTYRTNEAKGTEFTDTADVALRSDPALRDAVDESKKEYFI